MQKRILFFVLIPALFSLWAFTNVPNIATNGSPKPLTSGFSRLSVAGNFTVTIVKSATQKIEIEGSKEVVDNVITEIEDKELKIRWSGSKKEVKNTRITIYSPILTGISVAGSANVVSNDAFEADAAYVNIAGSGNIAYNVSGNSLEVSIAGSGDLKMTGSMKKSEVSIAGSGDADLSELKSLDSEVSISGSGDCQIHASNSLEVSIAGSGEVAYKGNPSIEKSILGSGNVHKM